MATTSRPPTKSFGAPPPGYVAGIGRGAVGFTTRSDIGPAKAVATREDRYAAQRGATAAALTMSGLAAPPQPREEDLSESNFDAFSGYGGSLFDASTPYDAEDREADNVYETVDRRMEERRADYKARRAQEEDAERQKTRPKIQEQFADLKRQLSSLSEEEWLNIPEPADLSKRNKRSGNGRTELFTPVPDSVIASSIASTQRVNSIDVTLAGMATPLTQTAPTPTPSDLTKLGEARYKVLGIHLDKMSDSVTGQTVVNPREFLTDLRSVTVMNDAEVSDVKKARTLLKSVITTNPKHPPGWIAAARLEEAAGKISVARKLIMKGCEACSDSQDVWLEAARLHPPKEARAILARAVSAVPTSVKIWMQAVKLEEDDKSKRAVLRRALEFVPGSVRLWKSAIELEDPESARVLLAFAVECVPQSVEMWLALARLESYENAKKVLNRARKAIPTDPSIWITAAQLEEANGGYDRIDAIIQKAVVSLAAQNVIIDREQWLVEAEDAERSGSHLTCQAIVRATLGIGIEPQDRRATWSTDAAAKLAAGSVVTARAIMAQTLLAFPNKVSLWWDAVQLEKHHGTHESLMKTLLDAVTHCPDAEVLWLMSAKEQWMAGDIQAARETLTKAFESNPNSEDIWLAAVKMESEIGEHERARALLARARARAPGARVWMKSAKLEREIGDSKSEREVLLQGLEAYPDFWKLWAMLIQNQSSAGDMNAAHQSCRDALKHCPDSIQLWIITARLDADTVGISKARADLETARQRLPKNDQLWLEAVRMEERACADNNTELQRQPATRLMAKALQECPNSGILWSHAIEMEPRPKRRAKSYDALKKCSDSSAVFVAVSRLFWQDRKIKKAKNWFERAVTADPDNGDAWGFYYRFAKQYFPEEHQLIIQRCAEADPRHGERWCQVAKAIGNERLQTQEICQKLADVLPDGLQ